jgi:putative acetyltransferase
MKQLKSWQWAPIPMIREFRNSDMDDILDIWLSASIKSHDFVAPESWESLLGDMRDVYIPASETVVYACANGLTGFYCLFYNRLAALFVAPDRQGLGIGSALIQNAKQRRRHLYLTVYKP